MVLPLQDQRHAKTPRRRSFFQLIPKTASVYHSKTNAVSCDAHSRQGHHALSAHVYEYQWHLALGTKSCISISAIATLYWQVYKANTVLGLARGTRDAAENKGSGSDEINAVSDLRPVEGNNMQTK